MSGKRPSDDLDPDYQDVVQPNKRLRSMQQDAKDATVRKIVTIIKDQFSQEIRNKEREIEVIDERIHQARGMLDRLRACIIASYYGGVGQKPNEPPDPNAANHPAIKKLIDRPKAAASANQAEESESSNQSAEASQEEKQEEHDAGLPSLEEICDSVNKPDPAPAPPTQEPTNGSGFDFDRVLGRKVAGGPSRFCVKKRIIVGNVSKYITADKREENDQSTHKWMVYVRGPREAPRIDHFVKKVWFYLHPSYRPNDLVEISEPPFHLTRRGWGEFPVRVQLHFVDPRHKKVDIIHQLKLDRTYTGLQTLGAETLVDVELDRHLFDETGTPLFPDLSVLSSGLPAKAGAPSSSSGAELQASPVKPSTSTAAPSGGPCAELQSTSSRVKASASAAKPSSSSSAELQATVKPSTSGAAPSSGSTTEVQATTSTAKASSSTAAPPSSSGAEVQGAKPGTEKAEQEPKPGTSLVRRSPRAKSRQDTRKPSPPEESGAKKPRKISEEDSLSKESAKPEETKDTNLKEEVEEKVLADAKASKQKPVVMTTAIPSSSRTNVDSSKLKPVTMVTGGTVPISAVTIATSTSRAVSKTTAGSPKTFLGDQKEAPTLVVPVKVKAEPLSPPRVTPATVPTAREPVTFSRGVDTKALVLPAQSKPLVGTAKPVKPGAVVGTVKPGAAGGTVKPGAAGAVGAAGGTVKPGAAGAVGVAGGTTMVGTPPQGIVITKIVPTTSKPVTTVQQTLTLKPQGLSSKGVTTATQQNITIIKQVKQEAGLGVTMATQPSVVVTAGTGPKAVLTSPQKGTILKLSGLPGQSSSPVVGSGSHMIVGQSSASTVVSGSHMIVGQGSTSVVGSGSHMIVGQSSTSVVGSGSHMIVGQSSASAIGSGSHMIVMSSQPSSSGSAQAVPRVVTSPPQGKAVLLSGVTPQMAQVPVKVEKMADAKVPVTPTKIGSASPTVPPGTPPQVRTISGAVIGGLSPVSKPHAGVSAGSVVQVAPQQLVTSPNVPGGTALVPPNVMNLPLVNVAPGAKVFLAAKSTDPAMKGKVILIPQTAIVKGIPLQQGQGSGVTVLQGSPMVQGVNMPAQVMGGTPQGGNIVHLVQGGGLASQGATLTPQVTGQSQVRGERSSPGVAQTVKAGSTITLPLQPGTSYILMQQPQGGASASGNVPGSSPSRPTTLMVQQVPQEQAGKPQVQVVPQPQTAAQPGAKPMQSFRIIPSPQAGGQSPTTEPGAKAAPSVATAGGHTFIALTPQQLSQIGKPGSQQIGAGQTLLVPVQNMQMAAAGAPTAQLVTKSASTPTVLTPSPSHKVATPRETPSTPSKVTSSLQKSILQMKLGLGSQVTGSRVTGTSPTPTLDVIELVARKVCVSGLQTKEQLISAVVRHVPLVDSNRVISQHPYCAQSRQQFFGWNIGKQRAAEWQRAVTARKVIDKVRASTKKLTLPTPTTREIMDWSRTHGYTPSAFNGPKEDDNYCELCGQKLRAKLRTAHEDCLKFWTANGPPSSCSGSADLCQMLEDSKPSQHADDNDLEVDVISLGHETKVVVKQEPMDEEDDHPRFFLPMSPAAEFVHDTAQKLGVKLEPVETTKDMFSPVLEEMVLKAALLFTNDVLRGALASAYQQNGLSTLRHAPPIILPSHIHQSVSSNPSCDFLSNSHMGVVAMEKEEPPAS